MNLRLTSASARFRLDAQDIEHLKTFSELAQTMQLPQNSKFTFCLRLGLSAVSKLECDSQLFCLEVPERPLRDWLQGGETEWQTSFQDTNFLAIVEKDLHRGRMPKQVLK